MSDGLMHAILEIYLTRRTRRFQWRLIARNGEKLARGSQARGFARVASCYRNATLTCLALAGTYGDMLPTNTPAIGSDTITSKNGHTLTIRRLS